MGFHCTGKLTLTNDEGKVFTYEAETFGHGLVLRGKDGEYHYSSDKPPILVEHLKKDISELSQQLKLKKEELKRLSKDIS